MTTLNRLRRLSDLRLLVRYRLYTLCAAVVTPHTDHHRALLVEASDTVGEINRRAA